MADKGEKEEKEKGEKEEKEKGGKEREGIILCDECDKFEAIIKCPMCPKISQLMCEECAQRIHSLRRGKGHNPQIITKEKEVEERGERGERERERERGERGEERGEERERIGEKERRRERERGVCFYLLSNCFLVLLFRQDSYKRPVQQSRVFCLQRAGERSQSQQKKMTSYFNEQNGSITLVRDGIPSYVLRFGDKSQLTLWRENLLRLGLIQ